MMVEDGKTAGQGHILSGIDESLAKLRASLQEMGGSIEQQFEIVEAILRGDTGRGEELLANEERINRMEVDLIYECTSFIMRYSPLGRDLRLATRGIRQAADMERMGDEIQHVGEILGDPEQDLLRDDEWTTAMRGLVELTKKALTGSLRAVRDGDLKLARKVVKGDKAINDAYEQCDILGMAGLSDGHFDGSGLIARHRVGRSLERIGDHAKNICQEMAVAVRGDDRENGMIAKVAKEDKEAKKAKPEGG